MTSHQKNKGKEPAFPNSNYAPETGLSKREWLAGMAIEQIHPNFAYSPRWAKDVSKLAVELADALLEELEKTK